MIILSQCVFSDTGYPTKGLIYNTTEDSSLTYNCTKLQSGFLECEFVQTSVRKISKPEDLKKKIEQAKTQFPDAVKEYSSEKVCESTNTYLDILEGKITPEQAAHTVLKSEINDEQEFTRGMKEMSKSKKDDLQEILRASNEFCNTHSEESYLKLTQLQINKEMRTCAVSSNFFKQTFRWVSDSTSGVGAWVVDGKTEGPCGIIQLSRFELDNKHTFWKYYAKKATTNPKGTVLPGISCSNIDEHEYLYDWKTDRDYKLGCEYIKFSPL